MSLRLPRPELKSHLPIVLSCYGSQGLYLAKAALDCEPVLKMILDRGVDINGTDFSQVRNACALKVNLPKDFWWSDVGADHGSSYQTPNGMTLLHSAATAGSVDALRLLIERGVDVLAKLRVSLVLLYVF